MRSIMSSFVVKIPTNDRWAGVYLTHITSIRRAHFNIDHHFTGYDL